MRGKCNILSRLATFALLFSVVSLVQAQNGTYFISGKITDATGAAISSAAIQISSKGSKKDYQVIADASGQYVITGIPSGEYLVRVSAAGFSSVQRIVQVQGSVQSLDLELGASNVFETVTVIAQESGYQPLSATIGSRIDTPLRDLPAAVQIITRQLIDDQGATNIQDIVRNVSGVNVPHSAGARAEAFTIRGFTSIENTYRDGYRNGYSANRSSTELANVERVEVLKGPASILFGRLDPSGVVNLVTKKPLADHYYSVQFQGGSYKYLRPQLDFSGPLRSNLLYRLNMAYENADTFRDYNERERFFAAPSLNWLVSPKTSILFESEYLNDHRLVDRGLVALRGGVAPVLVSTFYGDPGIPYFNKNVKAGITLNTNLTDVTTFRSALRVSVSLPEYYSRQAQAVIDLNSRYTGTNTAVLATRANCARLGTTACVEISQDRSDQLWHTYNWQNDLATKFTLFGFQNSMVVGGDGQMEISELANMVSTTRQLMDIFNPSYKFAPDTLIRGYDFNRKNVGGGLFLQDQIALRDDLKITVGGRFDYVRTSRNDYYSATKRSPVLDRQSTIDKKFSPRAGIVYQPYNPISLYFNYAQSFIPVLTFGVDTKPFKPETGEIYETGVKFSFWRNRLTTSVAVFDITRANVSTSDPDNTGYSIQIGEQSSRGFEWDFSAQLKRNWNIIATYAYTDVKITKDNFRNAHLIGNLVLGAPKETGSLWMTYEFSSGRLKGFGAGIGAFGVTDRFGDNAHTFRLPGYVRVDTTAYYKIYSQEKLKMRLGVNVNNLLDKLYYEGVQSSVSIIPGSPRNAVGNIQFIF